MFDPFLLNLWEYSAAPTAVATRISIDWNETAEAHVFTVDVTGVEKEDVRVEVENGSILQISGERRKEQRKFFRRFSLPENARLEKVKAVVENGVLTVTVPKEEVEKANVKAIDVSG